MFCSTRPSQSNRALVRNAWARPVLRSRRPRAPDRLAVASRSPEDRNRGARGDQRMRRVCGRCVPAGAVAFILAGTLASCSSTAAAPARVPPRPTLRFQVITKTTQKLDSIVWTGRQFLYVQNTRNTVWAAPPAGRPLHKFATMPTLVEETRCILSPGSHGFPSGAIFCHSPDNKIY